MISNYLTLWCFNIVGREILTLGEGFNTQVITLWCFNIVTEPETLLPCRFVYSYMNSGGLAKVDRCEPAPGAEARVLEIEDVMAADAMGVEEAQARLVHEEKALPPS